MNKTEYSRKKVIIFLLWTFIAAYLIQFIAASVYRTNMQAGQIIVAVMMFVPALGVLLCGRGFAGMGWKPEIRRNLRYYLLAWFSPMILSAAGMALYFLFFPGHFDLSGEYMAYSAGEETMRQMETQGVSYPMYVLVTFISAITIAPLINTVVALGEELGWRGFLYPQLKERFGKQTGWILGGIIWGVWHWPLIALIGYEYGAAAGNPIGYAGFPVSGMITFGFVTVGWGILHDWLYEKSESIWVPSLFHGAINAFAGFPLVLCIINTGTARLLGPAPVGVLSGLPFLLIALMLYLKAGKESGAE